MITRILNTIPMFKGVLVQKVFKSPIVKQRENFGEGEFPSFPTTLPLGYRSNAITMLIQGESLRHQTKVPTSKPAIRH